MALLSVSGVRKKRFLIQKTLQQCVPTGKGFLIVSVARATVLPQATILLMKLIEQPVDYHGFTLNDTCDSQNHQCYIQDKSGHFIKCFEAETTKEAQAMAIAWLKEIYFDLFLETNET